MASYSVPGLYWGTDVSPLPVPGLETGVPVFLGYTKPVRVSTKSRDPWVVLSRWEDFGSHFGRSDEGGYLDPAVKGFFENGGHRCYVMPLCQKLAPKQALADGLERVARLEVVDLVCAPDIMRRIPGEQSDHSLIREMQNLVLEQCDRLGDRFAILDSPPDVMKDQIKDARRGLISKNGALYYPWLRVEDGDGTVPGCVPPCGHVAGIYARTDERVGPFKAPANELVEGVVDLTVHLSDEEQGPLNDMGVNCLRYFGGRGLRVWGARTLSGLPDWMYVNVQRLFIMLGRWIQQYQAHVSFESHTEKLWARIERDMNVYLGELFQRGALKGDTPSQAFYVKCDAETNSTFGREQGYLVTEIGLCPRVPGEFLVVQVFQKPDRLHIVGVPNLEHLPT